MRERVVIVSYGMRRRVVGATDGRTAEDTGLRVGESPCASVHLCACVWRAKCLHSASFTQRVRSFSRATPTLNDLLMNGVELTRATGAAAFSWSEASAQLNNGWA